MVLVYTPLYIIIMLFDYIFVSTNQEPSFATVVSIRPLRENVHASLKICSRMYSDSFDMGR